MKYLAAALLMFAGTAQAELTAQSDVGFETVNRVTASVSPQRAWTALVDEVGQWWHPDHTFFGDAAALSIEPRPLGCFCEAHRSGGVRHLQVVYAEPGRMLRLTGGLGPLQEHALQGSMTFLLETGDPDGDQQTTITLTYRVGGYLPSGLGAWAPAVDGVLALQLGRLQRHLDGQPLDREASP
ncbi:MAG: SRPBCC domain-containing protein [Xanthomonadales bacterium]|nr:SRPBCC domain-containing protein [Xanthomonadales bacterium]